MFSKKSLIYASTTLALTATAKPKEQLNIVYILADDLGYGDLGCFGQEVIKTPNIDKLCSEGLKFTQHYAGSTVCGPSRATMLTGKHTGNVYLRGNGKYALRQDPQDIIIPRLLKPLGYQTAMVGKSGLACNSSDAKLPGQKGFDYFFGFTSHTAAHWYYPPHLWRNSEKIVYKNNTNHEGDTFSTTEITKEALQFIDKAKDKPFYLHIAFTEPHVSLRAPEKFKKMYRGKFGKERPYRGSKRGYSGCKEPKTTYAAMVTHMDHNVGLVVEKLKKLGIADKTIVMFASDNGAAQEGGAQRKWFKSSGELRGGKRDMYEGGIRTPMIAWCPGIVKNGETDHISAFWDVMPTICDLTGAKAPKDIDGLSFASTLTGKSKQQKHKYLYWEFHEQGGKQAIRMGKWKAVRLNVKGKALKPIQLFDLSKDISEKKNIAKQYPEVVAEMEKLMLEARTPSSTFKIPLLDKKASN